MLANLNWIQFTTLLRFCFRADIKCTVNKMATYLNRNTLNSKCPEMVSNFHPMQQHEQPVKDDFGPKVLKQKESRSNH